MDYKLVGAPCGEHGPYIFYKALKYSKNGKTNILALSEFFFVKLWPDSDLISIGELQLLWEDKNSEQTLASLRLYILPENTPDGRLDVHGEDEVLAITEKVVIRVEDLLTWITHATDWNWGLGAVWDRNCPQKEKSTFNKSMALDMEDVKREKLALGPNHWETQTGVVVLSYPRYCRYRGIVKRLEGVEDRWLKTTLVAALGGFTAPWKDTRVLFCKDTFDYPELEGHELLCNHLAPKLKGRPRKRKKTSVSPDDSESESESSHSNSSATSKLEFVKPSSPTKYGITRPKPSLRCTPLEALKRKGPASDERNFLVSLHSFMRERKTPIGKMPIVGFKEVNLYKLYRKVRELGGYDVVCARKLWNSVYEMMGGDARRHGNTAGTLSRRHYEKLLLPYEKHMNGLKLPVKHRPTLSLPPVPLPRIDGRVVISRNSSLRNIRLKPEPRVNGEKENIPQRRISMMSSSSVLTIIPELAELIPKDTSIITGPRALSPFLKQQKLEILKEGGLEVTPVRPSANTVSRSSVTAAKMTSPAISPPDHSRNSEDDDQVSITVTPDMTHLLCPPGVPGPSRRAPMPIVKEVKRSIPDALDLRLNNKPLLNIGSNLEITLVPPKPQPHILPRGVTVTKKKPTLSTPVQATSPAVRVPTLPYQPYPGSYKPFVPVVDPVYLSVISSTGPIHATSATTGRSPSSTTATGPTTVATTDLYKEFLRNKQSVFIRDGTTSITLVGPSSNSKH